MLRVIKFVIDTKTFCLKICPESKIKNWSLHVFCDSDWAGDSEKRISVTGFIVYLMNVPVCWISKAQRGVTLSSSEAKYVAISEAVKEIKFIYYFLRKIGIEVNLLFTVKTDNVGAMFMAQNALSGVRTCHIDTRYHYVRENLEEGIINIDFVKSIENDSDIFTKNVSQEIYVKHVTIRTELFGMGGCWRYIPQVHIILDISLRISNRDNLQRYGKEFSST
jgi:hypothetical protein